MSTVHAPASCFNRVLSARCEDNAPALLVSGHVDESTTYPDDDDNRAAWAEFEQGMLEHDNDIACQRADETHVATMGKAIAHAKSLVGNVEIRFTRELIVTATGTTVNYVCRVRGIKGAHFGESTIPTEAADNVACAIDGNYLDWEDNGFIVTGLVFVRSAPHRTEDDARQIARRIALDPTYLDACTRYHVDGVHDLRNAPPAAIVA